MSKLTQPLILKALTKNSALSATRKTNPNKAKVKIGKIDASSCLSRDYEKNPLKGFKRITLNPGQKKKVEFTLTPYQLSFLDRNLERVVKPGTFEVMVGASSEDIRLRGTFEVEQ